MHNHGGHPERDFNRLGIAPSEVIDFSVNVSPLGIPGIVKELWPNLLSECDSYPSVDGVGLKDYYVSRFGLDENCVLPGNGSIDLIYDVPRMLNIQRALIPQPSFHDYTRSCEVNNIEVIAGQLDQLEGCDAHFIGNPNNPTGKLIPAEILLQLADNFPEIIFFVDEAFIQFVEAAEGITLLKPERLRDNIIVFHSLTKIYALPGIRLGACISTARTIALVESKRPPWMVSRIAERVAEALTKNDEYEVELIHLINSERIRLFNALQNHPKLKPTTGAANFLLIQWTGSDELDDLITHLLKHGIYIRDCRNFPTLEDNWFRIAIRTPKDNDVLLNILSAL